MKEKLMDLASRVEAKADDLEVIRRVGNNILVRLANPATGGDVRRVTRSWLEAYEEELDAFATDADFPVSADDTEA